MRFPHCARLLGWRYLYKNPTFKDSTSKDLPLLPTLSWVLVLTYILTVETLQAIDDSICRSLGAFAVKLGSNFSRFEKNPNFLINFGFLVLELKKILEVIEALLEASDAK